MPQENEQLEMTFDPKVIEHLGVRMYSTLPPVLSELIANAYDADAENVEVELYDEGKKKIIVRDDGVGMSLGDIQNKFLVIGRNRREEEKNRLTKKRRKPIGKKGLGKLSFFGVVTTITVDTIKDKKRNVFAMDWGKLMSSKGAYVVDHKTKDEPTRKKSGTVITLTNIKRRSAFSDQDIANSISNFFIFDKSFNVAVKRNKGRKIRITNEMRFNLLEPEYEWNIPNDLKKLKQFPYLKAFTIKGKIITSQEPIRPSINARGITLFSRKKLVQAPYYFSESISSHFFSYLSGWLEVDFIDDLSEDVISTHRQSLNWEHPATRKLHSSLQRCISQIQSEWRKKRNEDRKKKFDQKLPKGWLDSMPRKMRKEVENLLKKLAALSLVEEEEIKIAKVIDNFLKIVPAYPYYHWRHLHEDLKESLIGLYQTGRYFEAAREGEQIYEDRVAKKGRSDEDGVPLFNNIFSPTQPVLKIESAPFRKEKTRRNIQQGQRSLSVGLVESFRNPISHSTRAKSKKFFNEDDCLDALSLISFLLRRVDKSKLVKKGKSVKKNG